MKKITLKNIKLLLLFLVPVGMYAQFTGPGTYKIKHATTNTYWTAVIDNFDEITLTTDVLTDNSQIFTIVEVTGETGDPSRVTNGMQLYNIVCNIGTFQSIEAGGGKYFPTEVAPYPATTNNPKKFAIFYDSGSGSSSMYDMSSNTSSRFGRDIGNDLVSYGTSPATNTKWLFEAVTLSTDNLDKSSIYMSNPVNNELVIKGLNSNVEQIEVYSLLGKSILQYKTDNSVSARLDVSALSSGIYVVKISGDNSSFSKKIVKQ